MSHKASTYVTLDLVTYEVEGTYHPAEPYDRETPAEPEHFEIDRIFTDLKTQKDGSEVAVDVTEIIGEDKFDEIQTKLNENLGAFTEHPEH